MLAKTETPIEQFLNTVSKAEATKTLKQIETNNLLKNAFLNELSTKLESCFDIETKGYTNTENLEELTKFISFQVDGYIETSLDLNNKSHTVKTVCELIETI